MANFIELKPNKTYASEDNARKAVERLLPNTTQRYFVAFNKEGRCYPVFIGPSCVTEGIHVHFMVVG